MYPGLLLNAEVKYPCLSGERHHLPCINFKDSARPAELPRWLSWHSICLERRRSRVRVPPEAALLFLKKRSCLRVSLLAFALSLQLIVHVHVIISHRDKANPSNDARRQLFFPKGKRRAASGGTRTRDVLCSRQTLYQPQLGRANLKFIQGKWRLSPD